MMNIRKEDDEDFTDLSRRVWAARLELRSRPDTPEHNEGYVGAFVIVLVNCDSAVDFIEKAQVHLQEEGFDIVAVEDLAPLSAGYFEANDLIKDLARRTIEYPLQWSTFDLFKDGADSRAGFH